MDEAEKQAFAIYEMICGSSGDRPFAFNTLEEMMRKTNEWKENNVALPMLRRSAPEVKLAFLNQSFEWLKAEAREHKNFRVCQTMVDAIQLVIEAALKPLPQEIVRRLLSEFRQDYSTARFYFPFEQFLSVLARDQVSEEIRDELRKLHLQFAPSPTGRIERREQEIRDCIAELMRVEGEKQLDHGRGPWSQIVFDEIGAKDDITRSGWEGLLEHCRTLEQTVPGTKWNTRSRELMAALGEHHATSTMLQWLALGPTPGQPTEARSPIEDSAYQKGIVWCLGLANEREVSIGIADFGIACLRKVRMMGAVSQKVGFACVQALGGMECQEAISQLTRLRVKVKYSVAQRLIDKSLHQAAERSGITVAELEDISVAEYGLNAEGKREIEVGDAKATVILGGDGRVAAVWHDAKGKLVKSAPSPIRKAFAKEIRSVASLAKDLEQAYSAQRVRLESSFVETRRIPLHHWREHFIENQLLGFLGRKLIWVFSNGTGWESSGLWFNGEIRNAAGQLVDFSAADNVRLWHPLSCDAGEVQQWRERIFAGGIRQPFRQAFREFYQVSDDERETKVYSNRFAGILMRQHQFASLCRARGWSYRLMGAGFDGFNVPSKNINSWNMHAEFYVDLPSDRDKSLLESALGEQSGVGINMFVSSDQVRFYRERREVGPDEVPAIVYSEVMRDVDLFTSVCSIGEDETWTDQGERGTGLFNSNFQEFSATMVLRAEILSRVLPHTTIAKRCDVVDKWLVVRGQLGTYRIQIGWGGVTLATDSGTRQLSIPKKILDAVSLDLAAIPIDLDYRTEMVLRKAHVLADDWKIDSPELVRQLMPE